MSQPAVGRVEAEVNMAATTGTCGSGSVYEKNVNMALNEIAMQNGCVPEWILLSESGPQHQKVCVHQMNFNPCEMKPIQCRSSLGNYLWDSTPPAGPDTVRK